MILGESLGKNLRKTAHKNNHTAHKNNHTAREVQQRIPIHVFLDKHNASRIITRPRIFWRYTLCNTTLPLSNNTPPATPLRQHLTRTHTHHSESTNHRTPFNVYKSIYRHDFSFTQILRPSSQTSWRTLQGCRRIPSVEDLRAQESTLVDSFFDSSYNIDSASFSQIEFQRYRITVVSCTARPFEMCAHRMGHSFRPNHTIVFRSLAGLDFFAVFYLYHIYNSSTETTALGVE